MQDDMEIGDVYGGLGDSDATGRLVPGPPWILGHRGTPREAPENTLSGMRRAMDCGLDGFEYDLRACRTGEAVMIHDADLERTTDGHGALSERTLPELFGVDAGSWFSKRFRGEPLPLFDEVLDVLGPEGQRPFHMIELKETGLVEAVQEGLEGTEPGLQVRAASFLREAVLEAKAAQMPTMLLAEEASEDDRKWCRDHGITAMGLGPAGWDTDAGRADWGRVERWGWSLDKPEHLLDAVRSGLTGFNTNEPYRAMAVRALCKLAPEDNGPYPIKVPDWVLEPESLGALERARGEWFGECEPTVTLRNPFPFPVEVRATVVFPSGAFELNGLPRILDLEPGEERSVTFDIRGGSRSPGRDPLFAALYKWKVSTGTDVLKPGGQLLFDAPMNRVRRVFAEGLTRRLVMLRESPDEAQATVTLRRKGSRLVVQIEDPGGLQDPHLIVRLAGHTHRAGQGLSLVLPEDFDRHPGGIEFTCGIEGLIGGQRALKRWAGGLPGGLGHGVPGRIMPLALG